MNTRQVFLSIFAGLMLACFGLAFQASPALAAPAAPVDIPITQPDGSTFTARAWGDEWQHGMETLDGYTIVRDDSSGYWVYASANDGALAPARSAAQQMLVVGRDAPAGLQPHARPAAADLPTRPAGNGPLLAPNSGQQPLLVIFVNFTDRTRFYALTDFEQKAFGATGSITDYYKKASFNQLEITRAAETQATTPAGFVEVTLSRPHPSNNSFSNTIAIEALTAANTYVNFTQFDATYGDNDGYVSGSELHILFILAGYEQSYCGDSCPGVKIWGHMNWLETPLVLDGVTLAQSSADGDYGGYTMFGEIHGYISEPDHSATIGIMVHEMGHDLSWPDLYDTDGTSSGVGRYSIMGSGSWNGGPSAGGTYSGDIPGMPDAWLKWYQGWIAPTPAVDGQTYALDQASANPEALLLGNNSGGVNWDFFRHSGTGEFWLVENRQLTGYDAGLPGCGILIWHIDETRSSQNDANQNENRRLVDLEQADGLRELNGSSGDRGDAGDPYPGSTFNPVFSPTSNPNSKYYSGSNSGMTATILTAGCATSMNVLVDKQEIVEKYVYLPVVLNQKSLSGRVTFKGAAARGKTIELRAWNGSAWVTHATTTTDTSGNYDFPAPDLSTYSDFYVRWMNNTGTDNYLWYWFCDTIDDPADNYTCNFDISDILLSAPAHNTSISLPYPFQWVRRSVSSDSYMIGFTDPNTWDYYSTAGLGWVNWANVTALAPAMYTNYIYRWDMAAEGPNGFGESLYYRNVVFLDRNSPALSAPTGLPVKHQPGELERVLALFERREHATRGDLYRIK